MGSSPGETGRATERRKPGPVWLATASATAGARGAAGAETPSEAGGPPDATFEPLRNCRTIARNGLKLCHASVDVTSM